MSGPKTLIEKENIQQSITSIDTANQNTPRHWPVTQPLVTVLVPAYNEAASLPELFRRTDAVLTQMNQPYEFIVVDDGSTDNTIQVFEELLAQNENCVLIQHARNHGKSLALMQGFANARGDILIMMDADLQDQPEMIPRFIHRLNEGFDLVNGWRRDRKDTASKRLVSRFYNFLTDRLLRCDVKDINCGFKAMTRPVYTKVRLRGDLHRLIPALASSAGFRVSEVPVNHADRKFGISKYKLLRHRGLLDIVSVAAMHSTQARPLHVFTELGFFTLIGGVLAGIGWIWLTVSGGNGTGHAVWLGLCAFFSLLLSFAGLLLPLFGFLLEVQTSHYQEQSWRASLIKAIRRSPTHGT